MNALSASLFNSQLIGALTLTAHYVTAGQPLAEASQRTRLSTVLQGCEDNPHLATLSQALSTTAEKELPASTTVLCNAITAVKQQVSETDPDYGLLMQAYQQLRAMETGTRMLTERRPSGIQPRVPAKSASVHEREQLLAELQDLSHDLRNPASVLLSCLECVEPEIDPEIASDCRHSLNNLMGLITVLDQLGAAEDNKAMNHPIDLRLYIQPAVIKRLFRKSKALIHLNWSVPQSPQTVYANGIALSRIIDNLISNSVEAMLHAEHRELSIASTVVDLEHDATRAQIAALIKQSGIHIGRSLYSGVYHHLSIQDTGRGMDAETMQLMFERYFSTKPDSTRLRGLGMHRAKKEIIEMDGSLYVISQPGHGTQFHLFFPGH